MCLQTCAVVTYSKDWMSWKVLSEGIIFSVYRITLTETGVKETPQFIAWYPSIVTHELMSEYMDCDRFFHTVLNKIGCSRSETQQLRDNRSLTISSRRTETVFLLPLFKDWRRQGHSLSTYSFHKWPLGDFRALQPVPKKGFDRQEAGRSSWEQGQM